MIVCQHDCSSSVMTRPFTVVLRGGGEGDDKHATNLVANTVSGRESRPKNCDEAYA